MARRGLQQRSKKPMKSRIQRAKTLDPFTEGEKRFNIFELILTYQNAVKKRKKNLSEPTSQKCLKGRPGE